MHLLWFGFGFFSVEKMCDGLTPRESPISGVQIKPFYNEIGCSISPFLPRSCQQISLAINLLIWPAKKFGHQFLDLAT